MPNISFSAAVAHSTRSRVAALSAVFVLTLLSGCGASGAGPVSGGDVAWSTGGGGSADADPVPSQPAASSATPETARESQRAGTPEGSLPAASSQDESLPTEGADGSDSSDSGADAETVGGAQSVLDGLAVSGKEDRASYDPQRFGGSVDADRNGCDTYNDVLRRDLDDVVVEGGTGGCAVIAGHLDDKYLGDSFAYERGSSKVAIDHIVSRSNAWQTGAAELSDGELREFANDPLNVVAVSSDLQREKSEGDAASWMPPNEAYRCEYVSRQIAVKHKYGLWVAAAEKDTMDEVLETCEDQPAFGENVDWPQPGEGDSVPPESAAEESSSEQSSESTTDGTSQEPAEGNSSNPTEQTSDETEQNSDDSEADSSNSESPSSDSSNSESPSSD